MSSLASALRTLSSLGPPPTLHLPSHQHLHGVPQIQGSQSGAEGSRTPDLRRARPRPHILACPSTSGILHVLQIIRGAAGSALSAVYQLVPARLQYVPTSPVCCRSMFRERVTLL